jgi:zinc protease
MCLQHHRKSDAPDAAPPGGGKDVTKFGRAALAAIALALTAGINAGGIAAKPAKSAAPAPHTAPHWAQTASDLQADPRVRFGILPNGMRYAIMKNATPPGEASLRLYVGAGSLEEQDDQQGLAHFIEHMVFNGTKHVPEGEFIRRLERHGLKFGPDTNASTNFDQTIYMLDLPEIDADTVDTGLYLLREVADEATLATSAIDSERGIILSEERTRATPGLRAFIDQIGFLLKGDLLPRRIPIGQTEIIRTAPRDRFVRFYEQYYRPDNSVLVAVGDFDVDAMETKIRTQFGSWQATGPAGADAPPAALPKRKTETRLYVEPGLPTQVGISWVRPPDLRPDSKARRAARTIDSLAFNILNRRLQRLATSDAPPFIAASASRNEIAERAELVQLGAIAKPDGWQNALASIEQEQRRVVRHGFTQAELDREIVERRAGLVAAAAAANTVTNPVLAARLVDAANEDNVVTSPADDLARFDETVRGLTAARVTDAARAMFRGDGPLVYMNAPAAIAGGEQALRSTYDRSLAVAVAPLSAQVAKNWPYDSFGEPSAVVERRELADIGATLVRFANGVRLTVKPTAFKDDEILVAVRFGSGMMALKPNAPSPFWGIGAFTQGGVGKLDQEEIEQVLSGAVYGANPGVEDDAFSLSGRTRPVDFARQMKLLAAYVTDPAWRTAPWDRGRSAASTIHNQLRSTPSGVFFRDTGALLHGGEPRWAFPSVEAMEGSKVEDLKSVLAPALATAPIEVVVVGDVTVDEAIRQTAATFGSLPTRGAAHVDPASAATHFPAPGLVRLTHEGRADQGLAFIAWPTTDFYADQKKARTLNLLSQVLQLRLIDEIREKQGTTYSPNAGHSASETWKGYGYMSAQIEAPPEKLEGFLADAAKIARSLADTPIDADELQRARKPLVENLQRQRASNNSWWLDQLSGIQERPEAAESIRVGIAQYESITAADLQAVARQYLVDAKAWKAIIVPKAAS